MESKTTVRLSKDVSNEIILISAITRSKGVGPFIDDLIQAWIIADSMGADLPVLKPVVLDKDKEYVTGCNRMNKELAASLRILAAKNDGMSLKAYIEAMLTWLAEEHKANGRVWIDDTPVKLLPIRTRK